MTSQDPPNGSDGPNDNDILSDKIFKIRPYRSDAYGEADIETKARLDIARLVARAGVIILSAITLASLWIFIFGTDAKRIEDATRFLTLIMGAVLGTVFRPTNPDH
jgi:hypothetical protein